MDNIVRNFEEIELTEAELEVIYGAEDPTDLWMPIGTVATISGNITTNNILSGIGALTATITDVSTFAGTVTRALS
jgi:hypothetical protein